MPQFIVLPSRIEGGLRSAKPAMMGFMKSLESTAATGVAKKLSKKFKVLDSIAKTGAKLVEMSEKDVMAIRSENPGVRVVPIVYYVPARFTAPAVKAPPSNGRKKAKKAAKASTTSPNASVLVTGNGQPIKKATVVAFTDYANRWGASGKTNAKGVATLPGIAHNATIEVLFVYPEMASGFYSGCRKNFKLAHGAEISLPPLDLTRKDVLRHFYACDGEGGAGVKVAVLDTGVGPHPDLPNVVGDDDNGDGHGTHVAGIIGANGEINGVAGEVSIKSCRVFDNDLKAANWTISKAIDEAVQAGCDLINLSLKIDYNDNPAGYAFDPAVEAAMEDAWNAGVLCVAAAGNDDRTAVDFPGRSAVCLAVTALGRKGTYPKDSSHTTAEMSPYGTDKKNFIGSFSNYGPEVDLTAPGVGVISTVPGGYDAMDGTSMATPAAVGAIARLLADSPEVLGAPRDAARTAAIVKLAADAAKSLGFAREYEGFGLIR